MDQQEVEKQFEQLGAIIILSKKAQLAAMDGSAANIGYLNELRTKMEDNLRNFLDVTYFNDIELDTHTKDDLFSIAETIGWMKATMWKPLDTSEYSEEHFYGAWYYSYTLEKIEELINEL
jgi:hypothetical protein